MIGHRDQDRWRTPPELIRAWAPDVDLCADPETRPHGIPYVGPGGEYGEDVRSPPGAVPRVVRRGWINPPFVGSATADYVAAGIRWMGAANPPMAHWLLLALVPAAVTTSWWHRLAARANRVILPSGRIAFCDRAGKRLPAPPQPGTCLLAFEPRHTAWRVDLVPLAQLPDELVALRRAGRTSP